MGRSSILSIYEMQLLSGVRNNINCYYYKKHHKKADRLKCVNVANKHSCSINNMLECHLHV